MPRLACFDGITLAMYAKDHNPPHFHAYYADDEAIFLIESGEILVGSLPSSKLRQVQAWAAENKTLLQETWKRLNPEK